MSIKHFRVPGNLRQRLEEAGIKVDAVLRRAGLPVNLFEQQRILVKTEELFALWQAIGEVSTNPSIGLQLGTEKNIALLHPIGLAALSTASFGDAVNHMAMYKQLSAPEEIVQSFDEEEWSIQFRWTLGLDAEPPVLIENCFASLLTIARFGTGASIKPLRVEFVQPRKHLRALERYFGCSIVCGTAQNAIIFRSADAKIPFQTRNAELLEMLAPQFDMELSRSQSNDERFVEQVRSTIQQRLTGYRPGVDVIARDLHMSQRTLQRRLQEVGSSFQKILDEARHQMARYYLSNSVLELTEAAYLLGYEDSNSFARAFRSWEGMPPKHWRALNQASQLRQETYRPN